MEAQSVESLLQQLTEEVLKLQKQVLVNTELLAADREHLDKLERASHVHWSIDYEARIARLEEDFNTRFD